MYLRLNKRGQNTMEYALLVAAIVGGLIAMQIYVKRGVQGRLRRSSDDIGDQFAAGETVSSYKTTRGSTTVEETEGGIVSSYMGHSDKGLGEKVRRTGSDEVGAW